MARYPVRLRNTLRTSFDGAYFWRPISLGVHAFAPFYTRYVWLYRCLARNHRLAGISCIRGLRYGHSDPGRYSTYTSKLFREYAELARDTLILVRDVAQLRH